MRKLLFAMLACLAICISCRQKTDGTAEAADTETLEIPECVITKVPDSLHLDPFYMKYVDVNGLPLVSSWRVPDSALVAAHKTLYAMTVMLPKDVLDSMVGRGTRVAMMARYEGTTDIPEHRYLANDTSINWDLRARGLEGTLDIPVTTCAEENVLCYQIDKYHAEDILIHEFAHSIHMIGLTLAVPGFNDRLQKLYENAMASGKMKNTYRETNKEEYWAEAVQDWFNVNAEMPYADGKHNWVNSREDLKEFDPEMYAFLAEYFPETTLHISKHAKVDEYHNPEKGS